MPLSSSPTSRIGLLSGIPIHCWAGAILVLVSWILNWTLEGPRTHIYFFPLWLGYTLVVDGLVYRRRGSSILTRSRLRFGLLFVMSAPAWWLFESFNHHTQNWNYHGAELFTDVEYAVLASVAFSTVMPAVFETAELVRSFSWVDGLYGGPRISPSRGITLGFFCAGWLLLVGIVLFPNMLYPFIWGSVFCLIEPANVWLGRPSLFDSLAQRDWRPTLSLALGALVCGIFWEFWNYWSYPKWTYHTPGVDFWYIFEMPLLGYVGYLPFGLELYALAHLVSGRKLGVRL